MASIRAYNGSELFGHFNELFDLLAQSHMLDLVDIRPEDLQRKQGAIRQLRQLSRSLNSPSIEPKS